MLGERRSKAAFSAGFPEAVREETRQDSGHLPEEIMETEASLDGLDGGPLLHCGQSVFHPHLPV